MSSLSICLARDDVDRAVALVPATLPSTWSGTAATACQSRLDELRAALAALDPLLDSASTAVSALELLGDSSSQCVAIP